MVSIGLLLLALPIVCVLYRYAINTNFHPALKITQTIALSCKMLCRKNLIIFALFPYPNGNFYL